MKKVKPIKIREDKECGLFRDSYADFKREGMCIDCYDRIREDKELYSYADFKREGMCIDCYDRIREDIDTYLSRF